MQGGPYARQAVARIGRPDMSRVQRTRIGSALDAFGQSRSLDQSPSQSYLGQETFSLRRASVRSSSPLLT